MNGKKVVAHDVLRAAAQAITQGPVGRMDDEEKDELLRRLRLQAVARRDDLIPDEVRQDIMAEVVIACAILGDTLPNEVTNLVISQVGPDGLRQILSESNEPWAYFDCGMDGCKGHVATYDVFEAGYRHQEEQNEQTEQMLYAQHMPTGFMGMVFGGQIRRQIEEQVSRLPMPSIIFVAGGTSDQPEEAPEGESLEEAAAEEAEVTVGAEPGPPAPPDIPEE